MKIKILKPRSGWLRAGGGSEPDGWVNQYEFHQHRASFDSFEDALAVAERQENPETMTFHSAPDAETLKHGGGEMIIHSYAQVKRFVERA